MPPSTSIERFPCSAKPLRAARPLPYSSRTALFTIRPLAAADPIQVERLLDGAFGTDRHGRTAYRLRAGAAPVADLSFAAFDEEEALAGTLQSWPVQLKPEHGPATPLILVGPVAVERLRQGRGLGKTLMQRMLSAWTGHVPLVLIGDPEYYSRFFGFSAAETVGWELPGPVERHRLLARAAGPLPAKGMLEARHG